MGNPHQICLRKSSAIGKEIAHLPLYCGFVDEDGVGEARLDQLVRVEKAFFVLVRQELLERLRKVADGLLERFLTVGWLDIEQCQISPQLGMLPDHLCLCDFGVVAHAAPQGQLFAHVAPVVAPWRLQLYR